uniref:RRM domain-containing protein n=1 Tax=Aegilops tauschii subsp. strangulata TaxID=200361 RepID=A0A453LBV5_AEGTS
MAAFALHEALECVVTHAVFCSYAFVLFCSVADSRAALEALCGSKVKGAFIRVEFAQQITSYPLLLYPPFGSAPTLEPLGIWL